ncbi:MAG: polysaccharide biosynthesis tyrosine autokinase [Armatimonas sp.]
MDIWRAFELLNRRKWLILFSLIVTTGIAYGATKLIGSKWVATVRLTSPQAMSNVASGQAPDSSREMLDRGNLKAMQGLYSAMLLSSEVINPAFGNVKQELPTGVDIARNIEFELVGPRLYEIHVTSPNPEKAVLLANSLADSFVEQNTKINTTQTEKAVTFLRGQLDSENARLERARKRYKDYANNHRIISSSDQIGRSALGAIDSARARLSENQRELAANTARLNDIEGQLSQVNAVLQTRPVLNGPRASALADQMDKVSSQLTELEATKGSEWPEVKNLKLMRNDLQSRVRETQQIEDAIAIFGQKLGQRTELEKTQAALRGRIAELNAQGGTLQSTISSEERRALDANNLNNPYSSLANEVKSMEEARSLTAGRLNNALTALDIAKSQNPIVILEKAGAGNPAVDSSAGRTTKLIGLTALCTLIGSCILVLGLDNIDRRIKNLGEAELLLPTRILAAIPQPDSSISYSQLAQVTVNAPRSLSSEAYRFLGMHLLASGGPGARSLMVVSAKAEQGSTTTVCNLAITLAQAGHRVVLVDANMRTAEMHQVFHMQNEFGFSDLLMDPTITSFDKALRPTGVDNLSVITSGSDAANPWQLFRSNNLQTVSRKLRDMADYVLYDTPSGVMFTDALNLAPVVDGAILCVRALEVPTGVEKRLTDLITESGVNVLGAVLSDVPVEMVAGYENYQHYYAPQAQVPLIPGAVNYHSNGNGNGTHGGNGIHTNGTHSNGTTSGPTMVATKEDREEM